jgi:hypothetical protein
VKQSLVLETKFQISIPHLPVHRPVRFLGYPHEMASTLGLYYIQVPPDILGTSWIETACQSFDRIFRSISVPQLRLSVRIMYAPIG